MKIIFFFFFKEKSKLIKLILLKNFFKYILMKLSPLKKFIFY
jgi:hypothetical protein